MAQRSFRTVASPTHAGRWHRHSRPLKLLQIHFLVTCLLMCHCKPLPPSCWINRLDRRQPLFHLWITLSGPLAWLDCLHHSRARVLERGHWRPLSRYSFLPPVSTTASALLPILPPGTSRRLMQGEAGLITFVAPFFPSPVYLSRAGLLVDDLAKR